MRVGKATAIAALAINLVFVGSVVSASSAAVRSESLVTTVHSALESKKLKPLRVEVITTQDAVFGETHPFTIKTTPKVSGTCHVNRWFGVSVGSFELKNGIAKGKHRWLWTTPGVTSLAFIATCKSSTHEGRGFAMVNVYK